MARADRGRVLRYGSVAVLVLAGWAALDPAGMSWAYLAAVVGYEAWLFGRMRAEERRPVPVGEPPYRFTAEEAELIGRYRFYFTFPTLSTQAASVLAAIGLSGMALALWLTFRQASVQGALVGLNLFAVGWFTKRRGRARQARRPAHARDPRSAVG
jgi:hypothetical protein